MPERRLTEASFRQECRIYLSNNRLENTPLTRPPATGFMTKAGTARKAFKVKPVLDKPAMNHYGPGTPALKAAAAHVAKLSLTTPLAPRADPNKPSARLHELRERFKLQDSRSAICRRCGRTGHFGFNCVESNCSVCRHPFADIREAHIVATAPAKNICRK